VEEEAALAVLKNRPTENALTLY